MGVHSENWKGPRGSVYRGVMEYLLTIVYRQQMHLKEFESLGTVSVSDNIPFVHIGCVIQILNFRKTSCYRMLFLLSAFFYSIFTAENLKFQNFGTKESIVIISPAHAPQELICLMTKRMKKRLILEFIKSQFYVGDLP